MHEATPTRPPIEEPAPRQEAEPAEPTGPTAWLREGARLLLLRAPRGSHWEAGPGLIAGLLLAQYALSAALQRALLDGDPGFDWSGLLGGWSGTALLLWLAWVLLRSRPPGAPTLSLATLAAQLFSLQLVLGGLSALALLALRATAGPSETWAPGLAWSAWLLPLAWAGLAQLRLFWRVSGHELARAAALVLTPLPLMLGAWLSPAVFWWPQPAEAAQAPAQDAEAAEPPYRGLPLTDAVVAAQPRLLAEALDGLAPPQPGRINVYGLSYAPYASEDVFLRESAVVAQTLREHFGADGRFVELVSNPAIVGVRPWATPLSLQTAIQRVAARMDRERDVFFLHLTSHGGADGRLAADTWPLQTEPLTPAQLRAWLDAAGIRWRVISVSACYSGSWIEPLAEPGTLVMTAADARHTSYGCGRRSPLTFFGRAMYAEQLRETQDFERAHAQARVLIAQREREAGKDDGYSNPQLRMGSALRPVLARLQRELQTR
jgi:hypothetical protein